MSEAIKFNREINLGHILQIAALIVAVVVFSVETDRRFTMLEVRQSYLDKMITELQQQTKMLAENQNLVIRNQERTSTILEIMQKQPRQKVSP